MSGVDRVIPGGPTRKLTGPKNGGVKGAWRDEDRSGIWDNIHFGKINPLTWLRSIVSGYWRRKGTGDARFEVPIWRLPAIWIRPASGGVARLIRPYLFQASLTVDADGGGDAWKHDPDGQPQLALAYEGDPPRYPDPTKIPYVVLPENFEKTLPGVQLGDLVAVLYNPGKRPEDGRVAFAICGDTGYDDQIGEASVATAARLSSDPVFHDAVNGGTPNGVTYIVFPHTAFNAPDDGLPPSIDARKIEQVTRQLFQAAGGNP